MQMSGFAFTIKTSLVVLALGVGAVASGVAGSAELERTLERKGSGPVRVCDAVVRGDRHVYRFSPDPMARYRIDVTSVEHNAVFQIYPMKDGSSGIGDEPDATRAYLPGASDEDDATSWTGTLKDRAVYAISVGGTRGNANFCLTIKSINRVGAKSVQ